MKKERLKELAEDKAWEILEAWWNEDKWEFADEHGLRDEELEEVLDFGFKHLFKS